jgi:hypothetical protein
MNVKINFKETFLNELKKSNIKLCDFCQQKKLNPNLIDKILIKSTWSSLFTENENLFFHEIENWLIYLFNFSVNRLFDQAICSRFCSDRKPTIYRKNKKMKIHNKSKAKLL